MVFAAMERLADRDPEITCIMVGHNSEHIVTPGRLSRLGYVKEEELIDPYQTSDTILLLSDFEEFGLPIAEPWPAECPS